MNNSDGRSHKGWSLANILKRTAVFLLILAVVLVGAGQVARMVLQNEFPPPGRMVDVGGHQLHLYCLGEGQPTVVLEAGQGDFSTVWALVQNEVAQEVRVCSYDRAGMGWSGRSAGDQTAADIAGDLHTLLANAGIKPPYILAGHSIGGLYVRQFASLYPEEVVGMVLVDSVHEEQIDRMPAAYRDADARIASQTIQTLKALGTLNKLGILALFRSLLPSTHPELPEPVQEANQSIIVSDSRYVETLQDDYRLYPARLDQFQVGDDPLRRIPLIVISHGFPQPPLDAIGMTEAVLREYEPIWQEMQKELSMLSERGELRIAEDSDHYIQLKQPEMVVDAIRDVIRTLEKPD